MHKSNAMYIRLFVMLIFVGHCYGLSAQRPPPYGDNAAAGRYLPTRGFKIYYESYGKGELHD